MRRVLEASWRPLREHRMLGLAAVTSFGIVALAVVGLLLDHRILVGAPIWMKALKFGISIAIYTWTLAWMLRYVRRWARQARVLCTVIAVGVTIENVLIAAQIVRGVRSHFNFTSLFDGVVTGVMGVFILLVWLANLALAVLLLRQRLPHPVLAAGLRAGTIIAVIGMALAFLMTFEEAGLIRNPSDGVMGAHTVGADDGGPGLPLLGWSTEAGDLRVPHFIGIHALQALPLAALVVMAMGRRWPWLSETNQRMLVWIVATGYAGLVAMTAWQAARGQSAVHPDAGTVIVTTLLATLVSAGCVAVLVAARRSTHLSAAVIDERVDERIND